LALRRQLFAVGAIVSATRTTTTDGTAHRCHRLADVRGYRFLINTALPLLAAARSALLATTLSATILATRWGGARTRSS
jgi:hypothetical protein